MVLRTSACLVSSSALGAATGEATTDVTTLKTAKMGKINRVEKSIARMFKER